MRTDTSVAVDGTVPATLDWRRASIERRNDRAIVVLELPTSTSAVATVTVTGDALRRHAAAWDLVPVTGSGKIPASPTDWEVWHTSGGLVVRLRERERGVLALLPSQNIAKRADLRLGETVDLLITVRSPDQFRTFSDFLRTSAKETVTGQALVGAVPHAASSPRYSYLDSAGVEHRQVPVGATVFVDQNVLIDMRAALLGDSGRTYSLAELRDHAAWLAQCDGIPGFAIAECRARLGRAAAAELGAAWEAWMESRPGFDELDQMAVRYRALLDDRRISGPEASGDDVPGRGLAALNYFALLNALEPWSRVRNGVFKPNDHIAAYEEWLNTLDQPRIGVPGHMGHAVRCLLLGKPGTPDVHEAASLLKVAKQRSPIVSELQGAAFDMLYPTLCDMANAGALPGVCTSAAFVLTADSPMTKARARVESGSGFVITSSGPVGFIAADTDYLDHYSHRQAQRIKELEDRVDLNAAFRLAMSSEGQWQFLHDKVDELENELLRRDILTGG